MTDQTVFHQVIVSPIGPVVFCSDGNGLISARWYGSDPVVSEPDWREGDAICREAAAQFGEYFAGTRTAFDVPLAPRGTAFQRLVWSALTAIPFGERVSYGELARRIGRPTAARAVGAANRWNPLWVIVPCHRVVGATGALTGYAGGLACKEWLLRHETACRPVRVPAPAVV